MMRAGAVVLCGGKSRRMQHPKAWLPFGGEALLQRVVRIVAEQAAPVVVVAARDQSLPPLPGDVEVIRDDIPDRGPLEGLIRGWGALGEDVELAFATAVDAPFLARGWIDRLVDRIGDADLAIPRVDGILQPLSALYRPGRVRGVASTALALGRSSLVDLVGQLRSREVGADELRDVDPDLSTLTNLNTPAEYVAALERAGFGPGVSGLGEHLTPRRR